MICPKCKSESGDDWSQCGGSCPMPMSPYYENISRSKAIITKDVHHKPKISRVGQVVEILRKGARNDVWVKTPDGKELVWKLSCLEIQKSST